MRAVVAVALVFGAVIGCANRGKQGETLLESVRTYHEGIRWARIPVAASRIPPDERADFITEWDNLSDDLRITDYELVQVAQGDLLSKVEVKYTWYLDSRQVVHETRAAEDWERHGEVWIKVGERRLRGEQMPGLAEPLEAADDPVEVRGD